MSFLGLQVGDAGFVNHRCYLSSVIAGCPAGTQGVVIRSEPRSPFVAGGVPGIGSAHGGKKSRLKRISHRWAQSSGPSAEGFAVIVKNRPRVAAGVLIDSGNAKGVRSYSPRLADAGGLPWDKHPQSKTLNGFFHLMFPMLETTAFRVGPIFGDSRGGLVPRLPRAVRGNGFAVLGISGSLGGNARWRSSIPDFHATRLK